MLTKEGESHIRQEVTWELMLVTALFPRDQPRRRKQLRPDPLLHIT